jgi:methionine synthase II (cobalamin-independent)
VDAALVTKAELDVIGEAIEAGVAILYGVVPGTDAEVSVARVAERIERLWLDLGFGRAQLPEMIVPTPSCGLAGASPAYARRALKVLREAGRRLIEGDA